MMCEMPGSRPLPTSIFHITHVDNLPSILAAQGLLSDVEMIERGGPATTVGMSTIKERRLSLPVTCDAGGCVGEYVPFYFCPRSIMLYLLHMGNHPELAYRGGQAPIVHLQADLEATIAWAARESRWAFSLSNAGARYSEFRNDPADLDEVNWSAVAATDFRSAEVKEGKQAEFLVRRFFPWRLVQRIGVLSTDMRDRVVAMFHDAQDPPSVDVIPRWYF